MGTNASILKKREIKSEFNFLYKKKKHTETFKDLFLQLN